MSKKPRLGRPYMPGYEMMFRKGRKPSSWSSAIKRLSASRNYLLGTVRPDGRPHVMPIWGVWLDNTFFFSTGTSSRKAKNLARNRNCLVCPDGLEQAVILEGTARRIAPSHPYFPKAVRAYDKKYKVKLDGSEGPTFLVHPTSVLVMVEDGSTNPTRWSFTK